MNIVFLKLYITDEVNSAFYNSQEMGLAKALVKAHPEHRVDIVLVSRSVTAREKVQVPDHDTARDPGNGGGEKSRITLHIVPGRGIGHHGIIDLSILEELNADLVHLLADNMFFAPRVINYCLKNNIRCHLYIGTIISDSSNGLKQLVNRTMIGRNLAAYKKVPVYVKTPHVQKQLQGFGIDAKLAPVGLDREALKTSGKDFYDIRQHYGLAFEKKILLYVGRLEDYKRPFDALELIKSLSDTEDGTGYLLLMIGDGILGDELDSRIRELGLQEKVRRIKKVPNAEMKDLFKACDYFVNFNRVEIYGMAILEAMAGGCPVFAMRAPGPDFLVEDGKTGFLCDSVEDMSDKISAFEKDEILRNAITGNARSHIENDLIWDKTVECFEDWNN